MDIHTEGRAQEVHLPEWKCSGGTNAADCITQKFRGPRLLLFAPLRRVAFSLFSPVHSAPSRAAASSFYWAHGIETSGFSYEGSIYERGN